MGMEVETKKEYLKGYEGVKWRIVRHQEYLQELRSNGISRTLLPDGMPHAQNQQDLSSYFALVDQAEQKGSKLQDKSSRICYKIQEKIETLKNLDEKNVLLYRYVCLKKWE